MKKNLFLLLLLAAPVLLPVCIDASTGHKGVVDFNILIIRGAVKDGLVYDQLFVDGESIGNCYENDDLKIPTGTYKGAMRYRSNKNFVGSGLGQMATEGDFLLEVTGVTGRTDILFHGGNRPKHSTGCILLGPVDKGPDGGVTVDKNHPLYKLRLKFYGEEFPTSCPDKNIVIEIR
jgi:hypothetical protein